LGASQDGVGVVREVPPYVDDAMPVIRCRELEKLMPRRDTPRVAVLTKVVGFRGALAVDRHIAVFWNG